MNQYPLVTVIIPTYNRADKLPDAIDSVLKQTYKATQIIVVDDGSTDSTAELVKNYPVIEYHYKENGGQASARNLGLRHSRGTIITSLDSDDIWYPTYLENCVTKLEAEQLDFVFANWDQETREKTTWDFLINDPFLKPYNGRLTNGWVNLDNEDLRDLYLKACPSPSSSVVLRKSSIVKGWDETINIGDDWCLYLDMILSAPRKSAYTLEKLWRKRVDKINVYDGRKWSEILEFLYVADLEVKMKRFSTLLRKDEMKILQKRYMESLVELSKHNFVREFDFGNAFRLLGKSFAINIPFTFKTLPRVYMNSFERKVLDKIRRKKSS